MMSKYLTDSQVKALLWDLDQKHKKFDTVIDAAIDMAKGNPVYWQFYQDEKWWGGTDNNNHKKNTIEAGYPVRDLFAIINTGDKT
jgi:hypothetical protein